MTHSDSVLVIKLLVSKRFDDATQIIPPALSPFISPFNKSGAGFRQKY